jgi:hypothetical protein
MEKNLLQIMLNITGNPGKYNDGGELASLASLLRLPFLRKSRLVAREQGRYAEKASAGKEIHPEITPRFRKVRRANRAPGRALLQRNPPVLEEEGLARPDQEVRRAS